MDIRKKKEEAMQLLCQQIPDENLRNMIFGNGIKKNPPDVLNDSDKILGHISRILIVAFHFLYFRYRKWTIVDNEIDNGPKDNDLIRIFKVLKKLYLFHDLSYDLMESILMDMQIDIALGGVISKELNISKEIQQDTNYAKMTYLAKRARNLARTNDDTPLSDRIDEFMTFIANFPFLSYLRTTFEQQTVKLFQEEGKEPIDFPIQRVLWEYTNRYQHVVIGGRDPYSGNIETYYGLIRVGGNFYFLNNIEFILPTLEVVTGSEMFKPDDDSDCEFIGIKLNYAPFQPNTPYASIIVGDDDRLLDDKFDKQFFYLKTSCKKFFFDNFSRSAIHANDNGQQIENFYAINYKYIRNLALAIVDILTPKDQMNIVNYYEKKCKDGEHKGDDRFNSLFDIKNGGIESLPWDVTIAILMVEDGASRLLRILFDGSESAFERLLSNLELRFGTELFPRQLLLKQASKEIDREIKNLRLRNSSGNEMFFLKNVTLDVQVRTIVANVTKAVNGNEILQNQIGFPISIRSYIQLIESIRSDSDLPKAQMNAIRSIVNQALGTLIKFYRAFFAYAKVKKEFETESFYRVMPDAQIQEYQQRASRKFEEERKKYRIKLSEANNDFNKIMAMLREICDDCTLGSENNQLLRYCLGRQQVLDFEYLEELLYLFKDPPESPNDDTVEKAIESVLKAFYYLQSGKRNSKPSRELSMKAIYPFVATYQFAKQTGDGYHINNFSIISPKGNEVTIKVMSEFNYILNEKYYCLPNKQSSAPNLNLWIEPVMIIYKNEEL